MLGAQVDSSIECLTIGIEPEAQNAKAEQRISPMLPEFGHLLAGGQANFNGADELRDVVGVNLLRGGAIIRVVRPVPGQPRQKHLQLGRARHPPRNEAERQRQALSLRFPLAQYALGEGVCLFPNVVIYTKTVIGHRVVIHAGTVIGSDGYGYVLDEGRHRKVLQVGHVIIHDDVEIGANAAIDRGALGATVIGAGTKIDNLVHVAHNVVMGRHCLIMGQVGFAGSTQLGDYVIIASQSGIAGHLKIGQQAIIAAKSGVMRDIPAGGKVLGLPAMPDKQAKRQIIAAQQLPEMIHRLRELEKQVSQLAAKLDSRP